MVVTDTHALLWYLTGDKQLGGGALRKFREAERGKLTLIIPAIVLLETLVITEKKRVALQWSDFLEKTLLFPRHQIYPVDAEAIFETKKVNSHLELHDRIIVAIARIHGAPLLTLDPEIKRYGKVKVIW